MLRFRFLPKKSYKRFFRDTNKQATAQVIKDMDAICSTFLARHQFKYGYMGATGIHTLNTEARQRMMENQPMIDELKGGRITARLIAYLFISETCQSFLRSDRGHTDGEAVFDLLKFTLDGLCQEKFLDQAAIREIIESMAPGKDHT
ncbi:MAG TPA: hypothetical protein VGN20_26295 [Mucilaginibacter sp.]|jgi:hypothetical protein